MFREEMHILQTLVRVDTRTHNRATVSLCPVVSYSLRYATFQALNMVKKQRESLPNFLEISGQ